MLYFPLDPDHVGKEFKLVESVSQDLVILLKNLLPLCCKNSNALDQVVVGGLKICQILIKAKKASTVTLMMHGSVLGDSSTLMLCSSHLNLQTSPLVSCPLTVAHAY